MEGKSKLRELSHAELDHVTRGAQPQCIPATTPPGTSLRASSPRPGGNRSDPGREEAVLTPQLATRWPPPTARRTFSDPTTRARSALFRPQTQTVGNCQLQQ